MNAKPNTFRNILNVIAYLIICAFIFLASFIINNMIANSLHFTLYFSVVCSLLLLLRLDIKLSRKNKARHSIGHIFLAGISMLLATLSAVDWIFLNILSDKWHYLLTAEGSLLCMLIAVSALLSLDEIEWQKNNEGYKQNMRFG